MTGSPTPSQSRRRPPLPPQLWSPPSRPPFDCLSASLTGSTRSALSTRPRFNLTLVHLTHLIPARSLKVESADLTSSFASRYPRSGWLERLSTEGVTRGQTKRLYCTVSGGSFAYGSKQDAKQERLKLTQLFCGPAEIEGAQHVFVVRRPVPPLRCQILTL